MSLNTRSLIFPIIITMIKASRSFRINERELDIFLPFFPNDEPQKVIRAKRTNEMCQYVLIKANQMVYSKFSLTCWFGALSKLAWLRTR